jgi:predicted O-methyltransferase YrrM
LHARFCTESGHEAPDIISVDHDKGWLEKTAETLDCYGLTRYVKLVHAPLIEQNFDGQLLPSYSLKPIEEATNQKSVDFLLIDGPPSAIGRGPCLPLFAHLLARSAVVLLDDFCRDGERAAVQQWKKSFEENIQSIKCALTGRGMAIIEWENMNRQECANQRKCQYVVS